MVVDDFHVKSIASLEAETYPPLIVDADAPLSLAISLQGFQWVRWREPQIFNQSRALQTWLFSKPAAAYAAAVSILPGSLLSVSFRKSTCLLALCTGSPCLGDSSASWLEIPIWKSIMDQQNARPDLLFGGELGVRACRPSYCRLSAAKSRKVSGVI